jgi:hypothetical protein
VGGKTGWEVEEDFLEMTDAERDELLRIDTG